ncbi:pyruvate ferredoxin oxidoreductase [candidate division MSBL1 archaeon SCGC-AAA259E19]|uniref:Pyruvate ferredoxin oxidoreductase n=1 Tax=candidate division MSBL1 archaeon SCGC-AAA259E19 TaxID=1698264 RepID=A0A133ULL2_9EURY|nr:pyruvate ferredoxin oxidoreductase [candidate division MSBL1 archaeon SCGC-AAA259E19]
MAEVMAGYDAIAEAVKSCDPDVISAYPITPQTDIVEELSQMKADGEVTGEFIKVDSEFNAASTCVGASAAGARVFSATCSQGLKLMSEVLFSASGMRLPLVLAIANRSLSAPLSIWGDHTDTFAERDGGMIQFYAEDVQEAMDNVLMAYKVAEDQEVSLPALACLDGFILTHVQEPVEVFDEDKVKEFLPERDPIFTLDPSDPITMGAYARPEHWTETRYMVHKAQMKAKDKIGEAVKDFAEIFGREYGLDHGGLLETYRAEDADIILIALGSVAGTVRYLVDEYRDNGEKVGLVRPRVYRPFPIEELRKVLSDAKAIGVLEKDVSLGYQGGLAIDLKSALYSTNLRAPVLDFIVGLAGRDVSKDNIRNIIEKTKEAAERGTHGMKFEEEEIWEPLYTEMLPEEDDR